MKFDSRRPLARTKGYF